ncbi:MAG: hypothetical protein J6K00_02805, partial [Oscillospiraceae bacterium]|nr:hypothetical protein [Oscillospiraceae bacterium]
QKWANIPHFRHINGEIGTMVVLISAPDSLSFELVELFSVYSRGRQYAPHEGAECLSEKLLAAKIDRRERSFAPCLPLEGKVSAQPTDEVFIQIRPRLYYDRREIK